MAGVASIVVVTGTTVLESKLAAEIADRFGFNATAGVHPHHARDCGPATIGELRELAKHPRWWPSANAASTSTATTRRIPTRRNGSSRSSSSLELGKPLFLHSRDAHPRFAEILRHHRVRQGGGTLLHRREGRAARLSRPRPLYRHQPAGSATSAAARISSSWLRDIPREHLLLETDSPYLTPRDLRPQPSRAAMSPPSSRTSRKPWRARSPAGRGSRGRDDAQRSDLVRHP